MGRGQGCEFRISGGNDDHIGGRLAEVNGFLAVVDLSGCCCEQMHGRSCYGFSGEKPGLRREYWGNKGLEPFFHES